MPSKGEQQCRRPGLLGGLGDQVPVQEARRDSSPRTTAVITESTEWPEGGWHPLPPGLGTPHTVAYGRFSQRSGPSSARAPAGLRGGGV